MKIDKSAGSLFPLVWVSDFGIVYKIQDMDAFQIRNAMRRLLIDAAQRMADDIKTGFESLTPAYGHSLMHIEERRLRTISQRSIHSYALQVPLYAALDAEAKRRDFHPFDQRNGSYADGEGLGDAKPKITRRPRKAAKEEVVLHS